MHIVNKMVTATLTLAFLVFVFGYVYYQRYDWIAASEKIDLTSYGAYTLSFESQIDASYELKLQTEIKIGAKEQKCRLGVGTRSLSECGGNAGPLIIAWTVKQGDIDLTAGQSNETSTGSWGKNSIAKTLTQFKTEKSKEYTVTINILEVDPNLATINPRLTASINSLVHKDTFVIFQLASYISYLLAALAGVIWSLFFVYRQWKIKHNKSLQSDSF